jgi:hypothetical protein
MYNYTKYFILKYRPRQEEFKKLVLVSYDFSMILHIIQKKKKRDPHLGHGLAHSTCAKGPCGGFQPNNRRPDVINLIRSFHIFFLSRTYPTGTLPSLQFLFVILFPKPPDR